MGISATADIAKQFLAYKNRLIRHYSNTIQYDNGSGTFTSFNGSYTEISPLIKIQSANQNGNLYFTTSKGVQKISAATAADLTSASGYITLSGGIKALDFTLSLNSQAGFFIQDSKVAYRIVWGIKDKANNLILGSPSQSEIIENSLSSSLVKNFNNLLSLLDVQAAASMSQTLQDTNYVALLKIPATVGASSTTLYNNLLSLASKLENDVNLVASPAASITTTSASLTSNIANIQFSGALPSWLTVGESVTVTGFSGTLLPLNTSKTITNIGPAKQTISVNTTADIAGSLAGTHFTLYNANDVTQYYVWYKVSGVGPDPAVVGMTGVEVDITNNDTAITIANATATALSGLGNFSVVTVDNNLKITNLVGGPSSAPTVATSGFTVSVFSPGGLYSLSFSLTNSDIASVNSTNGVVVQYEYEAITKPSAPQINPLNSDLVALQNYYNAIVALLQNEPTAKIANNTVTSPFDNSFATQSATVNLRITVPSEITTEYFYQIYRTALAQASGPIALSDVDPGDEMGLVYEANPTSAEITAKEIFIQDITPESFRGANLYTNPQSGEGILQANEPPPLTWDITNWKNVTFYGNTRTRYKKHFNLLGVENISPSSTFSISDGTTTNTFNFANSVSQVITVTTVADVAGNLAGKYFRIYSGQNGTSYYIWYKVAGVGTNPSISGATGIQVNLATNASAPTVASLTNTAINQINDFTATVLTNTITITAVVAGLTNSPTANTSGFTVLVTVPGNGENSATQTIVKSNASTPAQQVDETARSLVRVINKQSTGLVYAYYLSGTADVPGSIELEGRILAGTKYYLYVNNADTTGISFSPALPDTSTPSYQTIVVSDNEVAPNRLYYSKLQQPEAVPIVNFFDIGSKDYAIVRILPLRDSLFIIKEDAVYRLSGDGEPSTFSIALFDSSTIINGANSAVVLNNQVFMYSNQGVVAISDTGVTILSRPIENQLLPLVQQTAFLKTVFGVSYESDRSYMLWTTTDENDTHPTQCFRYNIFTQAWTKWNITKTCGLVLNELMYLGAADTNMIEVERKNFNRLDYADRQYTQTLNSNSINGNILNVGSTANISVGDVIEQVQYLTIYQLNQCLIKIDADTAVILKNYYSTLQASQGSNLRQILTALAVKLDAAPNTLIKTYAADIAAFTTSFVDTQLAYNTIVNNMNVDGGLNFSNYPNSVDIVPYESLIIAVDVVHSTITTLITLPLVVGPITTYEHISSSITWNVQIMTDPELFKHVSEAKFIFDRTNFYSATASYSSDVSPSFEELLFYKQNNGIFGYTEDSLNNFGGNADKSPFRTLIPRNKQRCRYIIPKIDHANAREKITLLGYSLVYTPYSTKPYRG